MLSRTNHICCNAPWRETSWAILLDQSAVGVTVIPLKKMRLLAMPIFFFYYCYYSYLFLVHGGVVDLVVDKTNSHS
jgi:hypothetical protein